MKTNWRKSSHSQGDNSECVELARLSRVVGLRDSKHPNAGHLALGQREFASFIAKVKTFER